MKTAKHALMRNINTLTILNHLRTAGACTKRQIQGATGLSWGAVSNITAQLVENGLLVEAHPPSGSPGRSPVCLDFAPLRSLTAGVDINVNGLTAVLADLRCETVSILHASLKSLDRGNVLEQLLDILHALLDNAHLRPEWLLGIGVSMQGSVSRDGSLSVYSPFFVNWNNVPLREILQREFSTVVHVMHDPNCMALAEQWIGAAKGIDDFALVRLSTGIGLSCVSGGQLLMGTTGTAGEFGHLVVNPYGPACSCGNRGCLEAYASRRGILARAEKGNFGEQPSRKAIFQPDSLADSEARLQDLAQRARAGDSSLQGLFTEAGFYLGVGIANLVNLLNPARIIIAGEMVSYRDLFWNEMLRVVQQSAWRFSPLDIVISSLPASSPALGAAVYFIKRALSGESSSLLPIGGNQNSSSAFSNTKYNN